MLADGINLPLVAGFGFAVFLPLNLLVTLIEGSVLRWLLNLPLRMTFKRLFWANALSTLAGALILGSQDAILYQLEVLDSVPSMLHGFRRAALLLIALYYLKSALVEGAFVARRKFSETTGRSRRALFRGVAVANLASYCVVAPIFYFSMRPTFGGLDATESTNWTANAALPVYYIDSSDSFIKRIRLDGTGRETLVPYATRDFLVTTDGQLFVYRGSDGNLYAYRLKSPRPQLIHATKSHFIMRSIAVSPDQHKIAFADGSGSADDTRCQLRLYDLRASSTIEIPGTSCEFFWGPLVEWSADGRYIHLASEKHSQFIEAAPPWRDVTAQLKSKPEVSPCYRQCGIETRWGADDWGVMFNSDRRNDTSIECYPYLGANVTVRQANRPLLHFSNDYGIMAFGLPAFERPTFLPTGPEVLLAWCDQFYLLDYKHKRLGLLTRGQRYVLPIDRFRSDLESQTDNARMPFGDDSAQQAASTPSPLTGR